MSTLQAALFYSGQLRWSVFAIGSNKMPLGLCPDCKEGRCPGRDACGCPVTTCHGFYAATTDPDVITRWYADNPARGLAIRCGAASGIVALDFDGDTGTRSLVALEERLGVLPFTATQLSGSGESFHLLYAHPGYPIPPSAGRLGAGVDVRGDGSYIVAAPTLHPRTGRPYSWCQRRIEPLAPWPAVLDELLLRTTPPPAPANPKVAALFGRVRRNSTGGRLAGILTTVVGATEGQRNDTVHWAACKAGEMVADGELTEDAAVQALTEAGEQIGLGRAELAATIRSGLTAPSVA